MHRNTLILITGYARSGKDTLADGMMSACYRPSTKLSFAEELKHKCNDYLEMFGFSKEEFNFFNDDFKTKHRDFLVSAGVLVRSVNKNYWANVVAAKCLDIARMAQQPHSVFVPDWRYLNEYETMRRYLPDWNIITVRVTTSEVLPANEEELKSIAQILREEPFDKEFFFAPNCAEHIKHEGRVYAHQLEL